MARSEAQIAFRKWYSACRACVRDQRNAGIARAQIRFHATHGALEVRLGGGWTAANLGFDRPAPGTCGRLDDKNAMWHMEYALLMATRARYANEALAGLGVYWYGMTLAYLAEQRVSVLP